MSDSGVPVVSVVMPAYNGERHIRESIESILHQTFQDWELIVVNDGSTDGTVAAVAEYHDPRLRYTARPNGGFTAAMNSAFKLVRGRYVAYQAQDDVSVPTRLEQSVAFLETHPEYELVHSAAIFIDVNGQEFSRWGGTGRQLSRPEAFYRLYLEGPAIATPTTLMRTRHLGSGSFWGDPALRVCSDFEHWLEVAHDFLIHEIPEPLAKMRRGAGHEYLSAQIEVVHRELATILRRVYVRYRTDALPVTRRHFRIAMSNLRLQESEYHFRRHAHGRALGSFVLAAAESRNPQVWRTAAYALLPRRVIDTLAPVARRLWKSRATRAD